VIFQSIAKIRRTVSWQKFQRMISKILRPNSDVSGLHSYQEESGLKSTLDALHSQGTALQAFKDSWSPLGKEYNALKDFCGGIASVMPGTSSVESDFSLTDWTSDPHSKSLTDFSSLESILHCKQYRTMESLST
jgi:hypothetical protein